MSNFNIQIVGAANLRQPINQFGLLEAQVKKVNQEMRQMVMLSQASPTNARGYNAMSKAVAHGSQVFRNAAASTGMFRAEQLKVNSATEDYTKRLEKQKVTFRDWARNSKVAQQAFREQLALQRMIVRELPNTKGGKTILDVVRPNTNTLPMVRDLDMARQRLGWFNENLRSSSMQLVNWGKNTQWAGRQLMVGLTFPLAAFGAVTAKLAYDVDKQLTRIQKVYDTTADQFSANTLEQANAMAELSRLNSDAMATAETAARQYGASINDTLDIQAELAATGLKGVELQAATTEVMRIATLGEMEHADALNATISLQSVFNMSTQELTESFNYMNSVENATSLQLADFAKAIPIASAPVKAFGGDIQELGILLTAMRERGIGAVQGANALKAAMQRLGRPSKQVQSEFEAITGQSIVELVDSSESLTEIFQRLGEVTAGLSAPQKRDIFAGLFGSYQVTRMSALVEGMQSLNDESTQVGRAFQLSGQDVSEWAEVAGKELNAIQTSLSGRFRIALETMKAELAGLGEPFLEIGIGVMDFLSKIVSWLGDMPDKWKKAFAIGTIIVAAAGPLIMLTGLFANLAGSVIRAVTGFAGLFLRFQILNKETAAGRLLAAATTTEFQRQASAADHNAMAIRNMTAALNESIISQRAMMNAQMGLPPTPTNFPMGWNPRNVQPGANGSTWHTAQGQFAKAPIKFPSQPVLNGQIPGMNSLLLPQSTVRASQVVADNTAKIKTGLDGAAVSGGIFGAAFAATMLSSNKTVDNIAQMALLAAIVAPLVWNIGKAMLLIQTTALTGGLVAMRATLASAILPMWVALRTSIAATTISIGMATTATGAMAAAARGAAAAFVTALGPVGLLIAGLTAAFFAIKKLREEAHEAGNEVKDMYNNSKPLSEIYGYTHREVDEIEAPEMQDPMENVRKIGNEYTGIINKIKAVEGEQRKYNEAVRLGIQVISSGGTVEQAKAATRDALMAAENLTEDEANKIILRFGGNMEDVDWVVQNATRSAQAAMGEAMAQATDKSWSEGAWQDLTEGWSWNPMDIEWSPSDVTVSDAAIESMRAAAREMHTAFLQEFNETGDASQFLSNIGSELEKIDAAIASSTGDERKVFQNMREEFIRAQAAAFGMADKFNELPATFFRSADALAIINQLLVQITDGTRITALENDKNRGIWDGILLAGLKARGAINAAADAAGKTAKNTRDAGNEADNAARKARNFASALKAAESIDLGQLFRDAMSGIQEDIAEDTMANFERGMEASLDATRRAGEAKMDAFDRRAEAAQNAMQRRFEKREQQIENSYDRRIDGIKKQIDAEQRADDTRQRLFDAEMSRIQRLNESANRNIDFNVALNTGNFDEAARIRNNSEADNEKFSLEAELEKADRRSERRRERLDKRIDTLEDLKDKSLDNLQKIEDAEKASLERSQERKRKALEEEVENDYEAAQQMWESRQNFLEEGLEDFTGYTAMSSKDLLRHMANWEEEYGLFNLSTERKFNRTVNDINKYLRDEIRDSRSQVMNDAMWETMGGRIASKMIRGAFGMSKQGFFKWLAGDGPGPKAGKGRNENGPPGTGNNTDNYKGAGGGNNQGAGGYASGGVLPGWTPGRDTHHFYSPTAGGLNLSGGEAIMRPEFTRAVGGAKGIAALNKAARKGDAFAQGGVIDGFSGLMSAGLAGAVSGAINTGIQKGAQRARKRDRKEAAMSMYGGALGNYSLPGVKPWVLEAANYLGGKYGIQTILGVGNRGNASDHPLGLALDFMTNNIKNGVSKGNALADEAIKIWQKLDATYLIWRARIHSFDSRGWRDYQHPLGATDPTSMHMDHVHLSFSPQGDTGDLPIGDTGRGTRGSGQYWKASVPGKGWVNSHDYGNNYNSPVYAIGPGTVTARQLPPSAGSGQHANAYPRGYGSYGVYSTLKVAGGPEVMYAHLWPGTQISGRVAGGQKIAESASTGNSSGPHTHFEVNGSTNASGLFSQLGIPLRKGTEFVRKDNTFANLHYGEAVLTKDINEQFRQGVARFAEGPNTSYDITMVFNGDVNDKAGMRKFVLDTIKDAERRKPRPRSA